MRSIDCDFIEIVRSLQRLSKLQSCSAEGALLSVCHGAKNKLQRDCFQRIQAIPDIPRKSLSVSARSRLQTSLGSVTSHLLDVLPLQVKLPGVIIVDDLEGFAAISEVPWVDPDLLKCLRHYHGHCGLKMDVCHQRDIISAQPLIFRSGGLTNKYSRDKHIQE